MFQTKIVQKIRKHFTFGKDFIFFENRDVYVYEIMWKNMVQPGRRMHLAFWIPKAKNTHSDYV